MNKKLEDVARLAGVSKTTVSRVINHRGYLSQKTIDKVHAAIKELDYHPNTIARQLFTKKTNLVGILIPTVANPFFGELTYYLEKELFAQGFKVLLGNVTNDPLEEEKYLQKLLGHQVDGLILGSHNLNIKEYQNSDLPIVAFDKRINDSVPIVESDSFLGGKLATQTLIESGAKHIIHTDGPLKIDTPEKNRRIAYEKVMKQNNLEPITYTVDFNADFTQKKNVLARIFKEHPDVDGIFASNDIDALLLINLAQELGYKIPDDLKIIGYDGTEYMQQLFPNLATIIQPIPAMAKKTALVLKDKLEQVETKKEYKFPVKLKRGKTI
ncbi:LacI family DNA-binding transcriptional regulator [Liquorilactobacillus satsumensis]|uniref:LacI family DNA-binding transcriptional regulator n=1 Tax=Liquorilactobacillus satsumensis TaxID=259059 RepID=UPI0021C2ABDE|nr:LacI family DNA-binding transcriptional regulator [Liquorilactobacillus satsumensis]MCP9313493.1 LacI family DNA-binding transcriptional regulator [Liquorilactobacillus satsumensis]MCP9329115.1 LacI family DNA-binding transcriptional regulator [Liquorilactobacillus satsumensis]MCP9360118.1 LacI family DNA-binding transcriptional regulator [Liquorilactobacillus satsumensis]